MTCITDFMGTEYRDTYHQHPSDSELWLRLFQMASSIEPLASNLMYMRNTGAILVRSEKYGYRIEPVIGVDGWSSREEYDRERRPLVKYQREIIEMLGKLG